MLKHWMSLTRNDNFKPSIRLGTLYGGKCGHRKALFVITKRYLFWFRLPHWRDFT